MAGGNPTTGSPHRPLPWSRPSCSKSCCGCPALSWAPHLAAALGDVSPWAFPSSHVLRATVIYGFLAVVLARSVPPTWRVLPYITAAVLVTAVALARLYLGVEWFTGVLATVALGLVWVAALGLAFRRHSAADPTLIGLWPVAAATFVLALSVHTWLRPPLDLDAYRPMPAPIDGDGAGMARRPLAHPAPAPRGHLAASHTAAEPPVRRGPPSPGRCPGPPGLGARPSGSTS